MNANTIKLIAFFGALAFCTWATLQLGGMISSCIS